MRGEGCSAAEPCCVLLVRVVRVGSALRGENTVTYVPSSCQAVSTRGGTGLRSLDHAGTVVLVSNTQETTEENKMPRPAKTAAAPVAPAAVEDTAPVTTPNGLVFDDEEDAPTTHRNT